MGLNLHLQLIRFLVQERRIQYLGVRLLANLSIWRTTQPCISILEVPDLLNWIFNVKSYFLFGYYYCKQQNHKDWYFWISKNFSAQISCNWLLKYIIIISLLKLVVFWVDFNLFWRIKPLKSIFFKPRSAHNGPNRGVRRN